MYSNGYVPPQPPTERNRRSSRPAYTNADASSVQPGQNGTAYRQPGAYPVRNHAAYDQGENYMKHMPQQGQNTPHMAQGNYWQSGPNVQQPWQQPAQDRYYQKPADNWQQPPRCENASQQNWQNGYPQYSGDWRQPQQGGGGKKPPRSPWKGVLIALIVVMLLAAGGVVGYHGYLDYQDQQYVDSYNARFCEGVYVDGIHLGGMTQQEGFTAVTQKAQQRNDAWSVKLTYNGQLVTEITASQLGMQVDVAETLNQAWRQGHEGNTAQRKQAMESLKTTPYQAYTALPGGDTSVIDSVLDQIRNKVYRAPQDAMIVQFNPELTYPFIFQDEVMGRTLNTEPIKQQLYQMVSTLESGEIAIVPEALQPNVTVEQLKKLVTLRSSVTTKISTTSTENRTNNIRRAFQSISGQIIQPGETFSFNGAVGERSAENGFYEAIEYAYGEEVMGIGGGVCQASSTLYQAAVNAGLEIVKREQHSKPVNYCDMGLDATVLWSSNRKIDLSFRNNTDSPIYLVAAVQSDPDSRKRLVAKCAIYGKDMGNVSFQLVAGVTQELDPPEEPEYVKDKKQEYVTYVDEEKVHSKAQKGYLVDSYRVTYVDGVETERHYLFTDRYEPKAEVIYVGTKKRE